MDVLLSCYNFQAVGAGSKLDLLLCVFHLFKINYNIAFNLESNMMVSEELHQFFEYVEYINFFFIKTAIIFLTNRLSSKTTVSVRDADTKWHIRQQ